MNWNFVSGAQREYEMITKLRSIDINSNITNLVSNTWAENNTDATYARHGSRSHGSTPSSKSIVMHLTLNLDLLLLVIICLKNGLEIQEFLILD
ncbi:hypothetical protein [Zunongwangia endophytica]|uniref:hypothetical protein n=1 Tax=Zunongwangia endophytica TaxID=1808945 RepID=UPI0025B5EC60|nr:hypothetical protein [Zunongwangia endophytica]MDN3596964.1 hypothetical protein [Zunongwangia endophytica]